jgi:predicted LPLAT superfamily acyltransferase
MIFIAAYTAVVAFFVLTAVIAYQADRRYLPR